MATIAVGDIHGNLPALLDLLDQVGSEVTRDDVVVFLGDYIDRGPDPRGCIEAILSFRARSLASVVGLRGNHEDWLLRTLADYSRHSWLLGLDALETVRSYSPEAERLLRDAIREAGLGLFLGHAKLPYDAFFDAVPALHRAFLSGLAFCFESPDCICTHAGLDPSVERLAEQQPQSFVWGHTAFPDEYRGALPVVYGHWNNAELDATGWPHPKSIGNTIGIDTIAHRVLTAVRLPDRHVYQSRRHPVATP